MGKNIESLEIHYKLKMGLGARRLWMGLDFTVGNGDSWKILGKTVR